MGRSLAWTAWLAGAGAAAAAILSAAALGQPPAADPIADLISRTDGDFKRNYLEPLLRASCPPGSDRKEPEAIGLQVATVPLQGLNPFRRDIGELTFVAGFHLTSADKRFGGLSGLDLRDDGGLLSVSDDGDFVWLDLAADGLTPKRALIAGMLDAEGNVLKGKAGADAEGLALNGDVALVSFERNHRVLAYDLGMCAAAARGAPIAFGDHSGSLAKAFDRAGLEVSNNQGPEGLAITPGWMLLAGLETQVGEASPVSARPLEASPEFDLAIGQDAPELVGLDALPSGTGGRDLRLFSIHRSSSALSSNAITIVETQLEATFDQTNLPARVTSEIEERSRSGYRVTSSRVLAEMNVFVTIDNFEGIAARALPDGRVRLYVISDDNFSAKQRTLLMIYETRA
jgi:hypothetical protein